MNGNLISREALKEKAETVTLWNGDIRRFVSYETIDNAPTIEPRIEYGTDGQPYRLSMSGGQVVPDTLQGWRYEEDSK